MADRVTEAEERDERAGPPVVEGGAARGRRVPRVLDRAEPVRLGRWRSGPAYGHAVDIIELERTLHLYFEPYVQEWYLDLPANGLIRLWNVYYGIAHFLVTLIALVWMFRRDPLRHRLLRNTLVLTTALAVIGFAAYSLMPPRLLDDPGRYGGCQVYAPGGGRRRRARRPVGAGLRQVRLRRHDRRLRRMDQLRQRGLRGRVQPVRRDAEHAHRLGHVDGHRARALAAPPLDARARHRLPGAHARVHRPHRQPLLDRRRRRPGLPGRPASGCARLITRPVPTRPPPPVRRPSQPSSAG